MPKLSICIPTYNRSKYLSELLESIISQDIPDLEVVVSDDASPDDTAAVVNGYKERLPGLNFIRQPQNIGLDRNFLAVVEHATGEYIWLMGDDDKLETGGAQRVLDAIDRWPGVSGLTVGVVDYDPHMEHPTGVRTMPPTQRLQGTASVFGLISDLLGFMSALVIDRRKWATVVNEDPISDYENYYVQVYIIGRVIERFGDWGVVNPSCVRFRSGNDQFLTKFGWLKRLKIDVIAYDQLADGLFATNPQGHRAMQERIFQTHVMARIRNAKTAPGRTPEVLAAIGFLYRHYHHIRAFWLSALPTLLMPKWVIRNARQAYKRYFKGSGAARARALSSQQ